MEDEVYIIIVTHNGMPWLPRCLESSKPYKVIVVDNNSNDGTVEYILDTYPEIILIEQKENLGFGKANNLGISYAIKEGGDYVFLLNQDAYLFPDTVEHLIRIHKENNNYGILSPIHINKDRNKLDANFSNYVSFYNNPHFYSDFVLGKELQTIYEVPFVNAAAWLISKKCLDIVGGFDPIFFHYGEDDNYCQRLKFHDFKIGVIPNEYVIHDRDDRIIIASKPYSKESLIEKERKFKINFANINIEKFSFEGDKKRLNKSILKSLLLGRFKLVIFFLKELEMVKRIESEIVLSRNWNITKGPHYL